MSKVPVDPLSLTIAALLTVGGGGVLSFFRHAVFHRSDAARMGWDYGTTKAPPTVERTFARLSAPNHSR